MTAALAPITASSTLPVIDEEKEGTMERSRMSGAWPLVLIGALLVAVVGACKSDGDPCAVLCECVERETGPEGGRACRTACAQSRSTQPPAEQRATCIAELTDEGIGACVPLCDRFGGGGGGPGPSPASPCGDDACNFCWLDTELENACPESFYGTGDGCDCGCQFSDPDCPGSL